MSEVNPFFEDETTVAFELPSLPIFAAGDAAQLHYAAELSRHLTEVAYVGSEASVARAASVFAHFREGAAAYGNMIAMMTDAPSTTLEVAGPPVRELLLGTAMLYGMIEREAHNSD